MRRRTRRGWCWRRGKRHRKRHLLHCFLEHASGNDHRIEVDFHDDDTWSYVADTTLIVRGRDEPFTIATATPCQGRRASPMLDADLRRAEGANMSISVAAFADLARNGAGGRKRRALARLTFIDRGRAHVASVRIDCGVELTGIALAGCTHSVITGKDVAGSVDRPAEDGAKRTANQGAGRAAVAAVDGVAEQSAGAGADDQAGGSVTALAVILAVRATMTGPGGQHTPIARIVAIIAGRVIVGRIGSRPL
jgi:hypothetical protein